mmetsp:Transcript_46340/g.81512  ORF Transcript_46340/g.81512 Transcript_46340/m.81512 type:complete len:320 (-) Transcript_46340:1932-2891(-)
MVLPSLQPCAKLTARYQEVDVVGSNKCLGHADNSTLQRTFSVVVGTVFSHIAGELGHFDIAAELLLEDSEEHLALPRLEPVDHAGNHTLHVVLGKMNQLLLHKVVVCQRRRSVIDNVVLPALGDPFLAVVSPFRVESHVDEIIVLCTFIHEQLHVVIDASEILPSFFRSAGTQAFVVLGLPTTTVIVFLFPLIVLVQCEECDRLLILMCDLDDRRHELLEEARHAQQRRKPMLNEVDDQPLDVRAIMVLVRHDHDGAVSQPSHIRVLRACVQGHDSHHLVNFFVLEHLFHRELSYVSQLSAKREHTKTIPTHHAEASNC